MTEVISFKDSSLLKNTENPFRWDVQVYETWFPSVAPTTQSNHLHGFYSQFSNQFSTVNCVAFLNIFNRQTIRMANGVKYLFSSELKEEETLFQVVVHQISFV